MLPRLRIAKLLFGPWNRRRQKMNQARCCAAAGTCPHLTLHGVAGGRVIRIKQPARVAIGEFGLLPVLASLPIAVVKTSPDVEPSLT